MREAIHKVCETDAARLPRLEKLERAWYHPAAGQFAICQHDGVAINAARIAKCNKLLEFKTCVLLENGYAGNAKRPGAILHALVWRICLEYGCCARDSAACADGQPSERGRMYAPNL